MGCLQAAELFCREEIFIWRAALDPCPKKLFWKAGGWRLNFNASTMINESIDA